MFILQAAEMFTILFFASYLKSEQMVAFMLHKFAARHVGSAKVVSYLPVMNVQKVIKFVK